MTKRTKYQPISGPLKFHGGKGYLAGEIVKLFPPRCKNPNKPADDDAGWLHYCEPYFGGGSVLLANAPEGISEIANDLSGNLINLWQVLADPPMFDKLRRHLEATPFSEDAYRGAVAKVGSGEAVENAWAFFIACRQSLAGRMNGFTGITKTRTRRGMNNEVSAWLSAIEGLPQVHERMKRVLIVNRPALEIITKHDGPQTLYYLDPPYLHETRSTTGEYGEHEMSHDDHVALLNTLGGIKGRFLLSGYRSDLYDSFADFCGWRRVEFDIANHAAGGKSKERKTECVWINFNAETAI